jgi:hypothetical protein
VGLSFESKEMAKRLRGGSFDGRGLWSGLENRGRCEEGYERRETSDRVNGKFSGENARKFANDI